MHGQGARRRKRKRATRGATCVGARVSLTSGNATVDQTTIIARIDGHGREERYVQLAATPGLWHLTVTSSRVSLTSPTPVAVHVATSTRLDLHVSHVSHDAEPAPDEAGDVVHVFSLASGALLLTYRSYIITVRPRRLS